jgi:hypothetical protein
MILNPSQLALCIMLAGDNHISGVLLYRITFWKKSGNARIPKMAGKWIANKHEFWKTDTRLSRDQLTRSLKYLEGQGLIEREQFWWEGRNILFVRPTTKTVEFLDAATTWPAAEELIAEAKNHPTEISICAEPSSATLLNSNGTSKSAHPASADLPNSNYIKNKHKMQHKIVTSGSSAVPTYPGKKNSAHAGSDSEEVSTAEILQSVIEHATNTPMALGTTTSTWIKSVNAHCPSQQSLKLSAKQRGFLASIAQNLGQCSKGNEAAGFQAYTADILDYGISNWTKWKTKVANPEPEAFHDSLGNIVNGWVGAGCPPCSL